MNKKNKIIESYITLVETIANGKMKILNFGVEDMNFYRGEIHMIKLIGDNPGIFSSEMARYLGITRAVVHKTLLKLEKRNFIIKKEIENDKKKKQLFLTDKGLEAYKLHEEYHNKNDKTFFEFIENLSSTEKETIENFLTNANEMIKRHF